MAIGVHPMQNFVRRAIVKLFLMRGLEIFLAFGNDSIFPDLIVTSNPAMRSFSPRVKKAKPRWRQPRTKMRMMKIKGTGFPPPPTLYPGSSFRT